MKTKWIESRGGPLLCADVVVAPYWKGRDASSIGASENDYIRACEQTDFLSKIPCADASVLVLGDEPMQSTFVERNGQIVIVRWIACKSYEEADSAIAALPSSLSSIEDEISYSITGGSIFMFDSAAILSEADLTTSISCSSGLYKVTTERYIDKGTFDFLVHRFQRI
ncbi:MAG TPA: Imm21 family immunity protein [Verrucomicrobiae bacterium]|nr:Imm21 family immunity protein [Verrucomicrobiae bacterium]